MAKGLQGFSWTMLLLFCAIQELGSWAMHTAVEGPGLGEPSDPALLAGGRVKRGWVWNQFFVVEEYTGTEPLYVGKIHSDSDEGDGSIKYTISGEGAGTIFLIDEITGDIHATERLDREQKTFYTLRAPSGTGRRTSCWSPSRSSSSRCRTSTTASRASWRGPTSAAWRSCPPSAPL